MSLIRNERLKQFATYLNGLAIATFALGGMAPIFSILYGTTANPISGFTALVAVSCLIGSAALHYVASVVLKGLQL
jgi:hypothetical protein